MRQMINTDYLYNLCKFSKIEMCILMVFIRRCLILLMCSSLFSKIVLHIIFD